MREGCFVIVVVVLGCVLISFSNLHASEAKRDAIEQRIADVTNRHWKTTKDFMLDSLKEIENATPEERLKLIKRKQPVDQQSVSELLGVITDNPEHQSVPVALGMIFFCLRDAEEEPLDISIAYEAMLSHHLDSKMTAFACFHAKEFRSSGVKDFVETVNRRTTEPLIRGISAYALAQQVDDRDKKITYLRSAIRDLGDFSSMDFEPAESRVKLEEWLGESDAAGSVTKSILDPLKDVAGRELYVLETLTVGKVAPVTKGEDLKGNRFDLKDLRGKPVAIVFNRSQLDKNACKAKRESLRSLMDEMKGEPFVLLEVSHGVKETVESHVENGEIVWPVVWDGPTAGGPIEKIWAVESWPTIYVIDSNGVIRNRDIYLRDLAGAVRSLIRK